MIKAGQIDQGMFLLEKGEPYQVVEREFVNPGKGSAFVRLKLKHVVSGSVLKPTYKTQDSVEECIVEDHDCQYLYSDGEAYHFMDASTYEQFEVAVAGAMVDKGLFMKDGETYRVVFWEGKPIDIKVPYKVVYEVTEAADAIKGDTVTGSDEDRYPGDRTDGKGTDLHQTGRESHDQYRNTGVCRTGKQLSFPDLLINKRVPFAFMGERLFFDLSQALFSSFKIDDGSRLLLKCLAREGDLEKRRTVADVGCGVGVLGLSLKKRFPKIWLEAVDRDVLALSMTIRNARLNGIEIDSCRPVLMDRLDGNPVDLLVSNVPAKAGEPVHAAFLASLSGRLTPDGLAALVIVKPLEESFYRLIAAAGMEIRYQEGSANHRVLLLAPQSPPAADHEMPDGAGLGAAFRLEKEFLLNRQKYRMQTVFGLPEFDTPSFALQNAATLLEKPEPGGSLLIVNPGQGHLSSALAARSKLEALAVAGRDLLQLTAAAHNISLNAPDLTPEIYPIPGIWQTPPPDRSRDWITLAVDLTPKAPADLGVGELLAALKPGGKLLVYGRSSPIHLFTRSVSARSGIRLIKNRKFRGNRAVLFRKA